MEHQKWQVNERRTLNIEPRTSNYATCRPPWSTVLTRGLTPPAGLDLHFCIPNLRSACSLPAGVGSAEEIGDLVLQAGGVDFVLPALHNLAAGGDQNRVRDRAFPFGIDDIRELISIFKFSNVVGA